MRELPHPVLTEPMVRVAWIVGHEFVSPGARLNVPESYGKNLSEYLFFNAIADNLVQKTLTDSLILSKKFLRDGVGIGGAYEQAMAWGADCAVELHFNAFNGKASGAETLCTHDREDREFASIVHQQVCASMGHKGSSRGVKPISRGARGAVNVYSFPVGPNCLIEPAFGDEPKDALRLVENQFQLVAALINAVRDYFFIDK